MIPLSIQNSTNSTKGKKSDRKNVHIKDHMIDEILERWKKANPISCHNLGIHEFDGKLPDMHPKTIERRIEELKEDIEQLKNLSSSSKMERFEIELISSKLSSELFELEERKEYTDSPLYWIIPLTLIETSFTARQFAPRDQRIKIINTFLLKIPDFIDMARYHLKPSLPRAKIEMALLFLNGIISYYRDSLIAFITKTDDEALIDQWSDANIKAIKALTTFKEDLEKTYLKQAHHNFALGKDKFMKLLEKTENINISYERLLEVGESDLERNYQSMLKIGKEVGDLSIFLEEVRTDFPSPENLIDEASATLERTRQFLVDTEIVPIPTDEQCKVIETPEFARNFAFAAMSTPGPFEVPEASEAYYWVTPPNLSWSAEKLNQFMQFFNKPFLEMVTIHEVWPGHYLQLLYNRQSKSEISKMMARSITMIEGWAHYAEEMIYNAGYGREIFDEPKLHAGQLFGALMRNCRYIAALKMHCEDWTVEDAKKLFMEKGFLTDAAAQIEANRGTIDPMYLNYTLGKLLIRKLRQDYQAEKGDAFELKEFHREILSYGSPQITALRGVMLEQPSDQIL